MTEHSFQKPEENFRLRQTTATTQGGGSDGCPCRLCRYDVEFAEHLAVVAPEHRPFFEELKERWEATDAALQSALAMQGGDD